MPDTITLEGDFVVGSLVSLHLHWQERSLKGSARCWSNQRQQQVTDEAKGPGGLDVETHLSSPQEGSIVPIRYPTSFLVALTKRSSGDSTLSAW